MKPLGSGLGLTKEGAETDIARKVKEEEKEAAENKTTSASMELWRMERDDVHRKKVAARNAE